MLCGFKCLSLERLCGFLIIGKSKFRCIKADLNVRRPLVLIVASHRTAFEVEP